MFFIFSKVLHFLIQPVTWLIILSALLFIIKRPDRKRKLQRILLGAIILFTNPFIIGHLEYWYSTKPIEISALPNESYDIGIVLGGYSMPTCLPDDRLHLNFDGSRLTQALELYHIGKIKKILITTGSGKLIGDKASEAEETEKFLLRIGIPASDIIIEGNSRNTFENAKYTAAIIKKDYPQTSLLLISSPFHLPRAEACFKKQGLNCTLFGAGSIKDKDGFVPSNIFLPSPHALLRWEILMKEWVGLAMYKVAGYI